ncbi:MAG: hypothetical protein IKE46_11000 [Selenomonadaceae bacterium]|nr:hypothetical protein [Selenomonadaceae bacterium]
MRKIFLLATLLMMILSATAFAEEADEKFPDEIFEKVDDLEVDQPDEVYVYTSEDFQYTITCPIKPLAVVQNPWEDPAKRGEMLVFDADGWDIRYAYYICVNAWDPDDKTIPDFNKGNTAAIGSYLSDLKNNSLFGDAKLVSITKNNKGIYAVTAASFEVTNKDTGEVEGEFVADRQDLYTFFRSPQGRCISIQLVTPDFSKTFVNTYRGSVMSFVDNSDKKPKNKKDKDKKDKDKKDKDKKDKDKKDKK